MKVLKFGGSSVGNPNALMKMKAIVCSKPQDSIVVVSAMKGVTNLLTSIYDKAIGGEKFDEELTVIRTLHTDTSKQILTDSAYKAYMEEFEEDFAVLESLKNGQCYKSPAEKDRIISLGERMSSRMISRLLDAEWVDAKDLIITNYNFGNADVLWNKTSQTINDRLAGVNHRVVVPGFYASTRDGRTTTMGRGGSDLSAAIIAAALNAEILEIWTDVNGMMTADPRIEPKAITLSALTYSEAAELSNFGAKVLYPPAVWPATKNKIPILIKNTFEPENPGTLISEKADERNDRPVKGISYIPNMSVVTLSGDVLLGKVGASAELFRILAEEDINISFISQTASEYSITIAVQASDGERTCEILNRHFHTDKTGGIAYNISIDNNMAILGLVGHNMRNMPGISGKMFSTLGKYGINISAIAQGSSELNISVILSMNDVVRAVRVLHDAFFLGGYVIMDIYAVGHGNVGDALLKQLKKQQQYIFDHYGISVRLRGIMDSKKMILSEENVMELYPDGWQERSITSSLDGFIQYITDNHSHSTLLVDCTANKVIADCYAKLLSNGINVVTANKIAASGRYEQYEQLHTLARENNCSFRYETNVGAGLPVLATIEDMVKSGDTITGIQAVLSGSLNFILNKIYAGATLAEALNKAAEAGFTEPDPRIDLSGKDVKRKLLILTRQAGYRIEDEEIEEHPFIPAELLKIDNKEEFMKGVAEYGKELESRMAELKKSNKCLRYIASFNNGNASIGLAEVEANHPFFHLDDSNNIIMIYSERYKEHPMTIRGYGAGAEVTAAGVFADIMKTILN